MSGMADMKVELKQLRFEINIFNAREYLPSVHPAKELYERVIKSAPVAILTKYGSNIIIACLQS